MRKEKNILELCQLAPDYIGFIFYEKSPRFVQNEKVLDLVNFFPKIKKVGVFVETTLDYLKKKITRHNFDYVQLHGKESADFCKKLKLLGIKIIKSFSIEEKFDFSLLSAYEKIVDYFLFDTKTIHYGGSGKTFDWKVLKNYNNSLPIFLSGGLSLKNIPDIAKLDFLKIYAIDLNSCFETKPALKNIADLKILNF